ncbi:hypothetical protein ACHHYP_07534 [Achlya hypogyna]|uniref:START domain-containing protein n=1 Tax=Achlya hypogyna TaxID=1202772 RepID=A0A1V9YQU2_ACHHY|nr:hypothetical protein ACHHYP_07534 [Achlya hypogyna]
MFSLKSLLNPDVAGDKEPSDRKRRHDRAKARYVEEVSYLQDRSLELQAQLDGLERSKKRKVHATGSVWEGFARRQALERQAAQLENTKLKGMLTQQLSIIHSLQSVLAQRPQLLTWPTLPLHDASLVRLPSARGPRHDALETAMAAELDRLDDTYRKFGLQNTLDTWKQVVVRVDDATQEIVLDVSFSLVVHVPLPTLVAAMTAIYIPTEDLHVANGSVEFLERFDKHTTYIRRRYAIHGLPEVIAQFACRSMASGDGGKYVLVSVMDDDAFPYPRHALRSREHIYASAEPLSAVSSRWKMVRRVHVPASVQGGVAAPIGALVELLLHCYSDNIDILMGLRFLLLNPAPPSQSSLERKCRHHVAKLRYEDEMADLRRQQYVLTMELETLEYARKLRASKTQWEGFARRQARARQAAVVENAQLKKVLQHHADVLQRLRAVLEPSPPDFDGVSDDAAVRTPLELPRNWTTSYLYERLELQRSFLPATFSRHGLDTNADSWKQIVSRVDGHAVVLEISCCLTVPAGFASVGDAMNCIYTPKHPLVVENRSIEILDVLDPSCHIGLHIHRLARETYRRCFARKCTALWDRMVFVEQTIAEPPEAVGRDLPYTETKYEALEYLSDASCKWKIFRSVRLPLSSATPAPVLVRDLVPSFAAGTDNVIAALESRRHERAKARYEDETSYLKHKLAELTRELDALTAAKRGGRRSRSAWEGFARRQAIEHEEALRENTKLKHQLEHHVALLQSLQSVLAIDRQPPLGEVIGAPATAPTSLAAEPATRRAAFHALVDAQFAQLPATFHKHGLAASVDTWKQIVVRHARNELRLDISFNLIVHAPVHDVGAAFQEIYAPARRRVVSNGSVALLETIDAQSHLLERIYAVAGQFELHTHLASKCYPGATEYAFVQQSVATDERFPLPPHVLSATDTIFSTVEAVDAGTSRWKSFRRVAVPLAKDTPGSIVELLLACYGDSIEVLSRALHRPFPTFPSVPVSASSPQSSSSKPPSDRKLRHDRAKARYNDEMAYLTRKRQELTDRIDELEKAKRHRSSKSVWEGFARRQALERQESMIENTRLKNVLQQQLAILADLQGVLTERPALASWPLMPGIEGPMAHLPKDPHRRTAQFTELMDAQVSQLQDIFKKHGLLDTSDTWKQIVVRNDGQHVVLDVSVSMVVNAPYKLLGKALERIVYVRDERRVVNGYIEPIESAEGCHLFRRVTTLPGLPKMAAEYAVKGYAFAKQIAFVMNSMFDDEAAAPMPAGVLRARETLFVTSEYLTETQARCKLYRKVYVPAVFVPGTPPSPSSDDGRPGVGSLLEMLLACYSDNIEAFVRAIYREFQPLLGADNLPDTLVESTADLITFNESACA